MKILGDMSLSAKQEINARFEQMKKEIIDMVKVRVPLMKSKVLPSVDFHFSNFFKRTNYVERTDGKFCCTVVSIT